ncbi:MAG: SPOR domain-containing protein [Marivibrio sp.]|uniref:SPOR domain-containing protein n=1 Tax=Marivibrio sp. TaxID=2039719 RepID=UPI0032EF2497
MNDARARDRRFRSRLPTAAAFALLLGGCSSLEGVFDFSFLSDWFSGESRVEGADAPAPRPELEDLAAGPPQLVAGDRFSFDNPAVTWTVDRVDDDRIFWSADNGDRQTTGLNPILPALAWESAGQGRGRRLITDMQPAFFPLKVGKRVTFNSTVSTDRPPYAWEFVWTCETLRTEEIDVPAGRFETYVIQCGRQSPNELTFYYAPQIGHYIRMVSRPGGGSERNRVTREMTDFLSRRYIAFIDPKTSAGEGALGAVQPSRALGDAAMAADGAAPPASPLVPVPVLENPMDEPDPRFDQQDGPVLIMRDGQTPTSELSGEGRAAAAGQPAAQQPAAQQTAAQQTAAQQPAAQPSDQAAAEPQQSAATPSVVQGAEVADGAVALHLASYKQQANAERGWRELSAANSDLLGGTRPIVRRVDVPGKGLFYRLYAGPIADMANARALCTALKARNLYCAARQL